MNTRFINIVKELKSTMSSWKMKLTVWLFLEYDGDNKKVETEMFEAVKQLCEKPILIICWWYQSQTNVII